MHRLVTCCLFSLMNTLKSLQTIEANEQNTLLHHRFTIWVLLCYFHLNICLAIPRRHGCLVQYSVFGYSHTAKPYKRAQPQTHQMIPAHPSAVCCSPDRLADSVLFDSHDSAEKGYWLSFSFIRGRLRHCQNGTIRMFAHVVMVTNTSYYYNAVLQSRLQDVCLYKAESFSMFAIC